MDEEPSAPLSLILFDSIITICNIFPSLNPLVLRDTDAYEVINLMNKLIRKGKLVDQPVQKQKTRKRVYADQVDWF